MRKFFTLCSVLCALTWQTQAQCPFPPGTPNGPCTGTPLTDGANINAGDTYSYSGAATTFNNVNLNGGVLQVCGTLTITNLNFNGGNIVVMSGGDLTLSGGVNLTTGHLITNHGTITINNSLNVGGTNGGFINYGTANISGSFSLTSATADLVNASPAAVFNAPSSVGNLSGEMVNLGQMIAGTISINGGSDVCLGPNSTLITGGLINNDPDGVVVRPAGSNACILYTGNALLNAVLSSDATLQICQATGATTSGSSFFGAATVTPDCSACAAVLPVVLESFHALIRGQQIDVHWKSSSEENMEGYGLEKSADGNNFSQVAFVQATNRPSSYRYSIPLQPTVFLRLRMQDRNGQIEHSKIIFIKSDDETKDKIKALCSPCNGGQLVLRLVSRAAQQGRLLISNVSGQVVQQMNVKLEEGQQDLIVPVTGLAAGLYIVQYSGSQYHLGPVRWMKGR